MFRPVFVSGGIVHWNSGYWYVVEKEGYVSVKNVASGSYRWTSRSDWVNVEMTGDKPGMEFWEGPPMGSEMFVVSESGVDVDKGGG